MTHQSATAERFRKKPVEIEAKRFEGGLESADECVAWARYYGSELKGYHDAIFVPTLEGNMKANPGDWIIRGIAGEFYPCKPDVFEATYERVEDGVSA